MKVDRLLGILTILTQKNKVKAKDLAERFEVSLRTIYRDIEDIGKAGIPIITYPGGDGGIGIEKGFKLDKSALTREEMQSILLGLKGLSSVMSNPSIRSLIAKLSPEPDRFISLKDEIIIDLASFYKNDLAPKIGLLREAILTKKAVRFEYCSKTGRTKRELEPYLITFKWSAWYVFGYCRLRDDFRLFKLSRLLHLEMTDDSFPFRDVPEESLNLDAFLSDPETKRYATLLLDRSLEYVAVDEYGPDSYEIVDHRILAKWDYVNEHEMVKTILGLGKGAKVLSPKSLVDAVRKEAKIILKQYE
ncbi:helix-turn-helix transcriptional regulator [Caproicibacter sp.]|uniref:helix-turn-helix transcriptional regulator n=1 Tax=Caproicibacter sp. TaxID=2814884 RepID=UPI003989F9F1